MVRNMVPKFRNRLDIDEMELGIYLRGNEPLYESLILVIRHRIEGRANLKVPSDPLMCKAILDRDSELQWLLSRLELVYHSSPVQEAEGEQPA